MSSHLNKQKRKEADKLVLQGTVIQDELQKDPQRSVDEIAATLDKAIIIYENALKVCPGHTDASYNLATALIERVQNEEVPRIDVTCYLRRAIMLLEGVIHADTSRRGEATGLAHRALANVFASYFAEAMSICGLSDAELERRTSSHYEDAAGILGGLSVDVIDYCLFKRDMLLKIIRISIPVSFEILDRAVFALRDVVTSIDQLLLSPHAHSTDIDAVKARVDVLASALECFLEQPEFVLAQFAGIHGNWLGEELYKSTLTLMALDGDDEDSRDSARFALESLSQLLTLIGRSDDFLLCIDSLGQLYAKYCSECKIVDSLADVADTLFAIGCSVRRHSSLCSSIIGGDPSLCARLVAILEKIDLFFSSRLTNCGVVLDPASCTSVESLLLRMSELWYKRVIIIEESSTIIKPSISAKDYEVIIYNLLCISWLTQQERQCAEYFIKYASLVAPRISPAGRSLREALEEIVTEFRQDRDLDGLERSFWFPGVMQEALERISKV
jgi:hypothetical protein